MSALASVGYFLVSVFFSLISFALWVRIGLRFFCVSTLNPMSQLIYKVTDPIVQPLSMVFKQQPQKNLKYDWVSFIVLVVVEFIKILCISLMAFGKLIPLLLLVIYVIADLIIQPCNLLFYAIIIRVVMSFANPEWNHPLNDLLRLVTEPLFRLGRRIIPDISGFDFAPFIILMILEVITLFIEHLLPLRLI